MSDALLDLKDQKFFCVLAPESLEHLTARELNKYGRVERFERLFICFGQLPELLPVWVQNIWLDPIVIEYASIKDAARQLKNIQRNWVPYAWQLHRRSELIRESLPKIVQKPRSFPCEISKIP